MDDQIDRILAKGYLSDVAQRPTAEIRALRAECQAVETKLSYLRRMVQGGHDVVGGELSRRRRGGRRDDVGQLVDQLPEILADRIRAPGPGRLPSTMQPGEFSGRLVDRWVAIVGDHGLGALADIDDDGLAVMAASLEGLELEVSNLRRELFGRIDTLQAELTRRYRDGEADVGELLQQADPS